MKYRFLGRSGLNVSALSFGSWVTFGEQVDTDLAYNQMKTAYDEGVNFFDNAEAYEKGKYNDGIPEGSRLTIEKYGWLKKTLLETEDWRTQLEKVKKLVPVAGDLGITMPQIALAWCLKNRNVSTVITGASNVKQVEQNMSAMDVVDKLDDEVMETIEEILDNKPGEEQDWRK